MLAKVENALLQGKTWQFLRYLHFRDYLSRVADDVESVCVCGSGRGLSELACAIEFPHIRFTLTDIVVKGLYPNYHDAMGRAWNWGVDNIHFSVWNVLHPTKRRFDLVASTEMLEHVANVPVAVTNMRAAATKYIYCLVPFADDATNNDLAKRQRVWETHKHFVAGFDQKSIESLFGEGIEMSGAYWRNAGLPLRHKLTAMTRDQIDTNQYQLIEEASNDLRDGVPHRLQEAAGIKILARANALVRTTPILPPSLDELVAARPA